MIYRAKFEKKKFLFNKNENIFIIIKKNNNIYFGDGMPLAKEFEIIYFGNEINRTINIKYEIFNKMGDIRKIWFKLGLDYKII